MNNNFDQTKIEMKAFVILGTNNYEMEPNKRLVALRRYLENALGLDIEILVDAILPNNSKNRGVILVKASSIGVVEASLDQYRNLFYFEVVEVGKLEWLLPADSFRFCVIAHNRPKNFSSCINKNKTYTAGVKIIAEVSFPEGGIYSSLWFLDAPSRLKAEQFGQSEWPNQLINATKAIPFKTYFAAGQDITNKRIDTNFANQVADVGTNYELINVGSTAAFFCSWSDPSADYLTLFKYRAQINSNVTYALSLDAYFYVWAAVNGNFGLYTTVESWNGGTLYSWSTPQLNNYPTSYNAPLISSGPTGVTAPASMVTMQLNISDSSLVPVSTPMADLLNNILTGVYNTNPAWPEDSYVGTVLAAYNWFIVQINVGNNGPTIIPNQGSFTGALPVYPGDDNGYGFLLDDYNTVFTQLSNELAYFVATNDWFAINGVFAAIISQINSGVSDYLIGCANLMEIPPNNSISLLPSMIIGLISSAVAAIPDCGAVFSLLINAAWTGAQAAGLASGGGNEPIQQVINDTDGLIVNYFNNLIEEITATTPSADPSWYNAVNSNWGSLFQFATGVSNQTISTNFLYSTDPTTGKLIFNNGYISSIQKGWKETIYKALIQNANFTPSCSVSTDTDEPTNPWNPAIGNYDYTYWIPGQIRKSSGTGTEPGFIIFECSAENIPAAAMNDMFGAGNLNVNPIDFFMGKNGWNPSLKTPVYQIFYTDSNMIGSFD